MKELLSVIKQNIVIYLLIFALLATLANFVFENYNAYQLGNKGMKYVENQRILHSTQSLLSTIKDAEKAQRGYLLTGENTYLTAVDDAVQKTDIELKRLSALIGDNAIQRRKIQTIKANIDTKYKILYKKIKTRRNEGYEAALLLMKDGDGQKLMDEIEKNIYEIEVSEDIFLDETGDQIESNVTWLLVLRIGYGVLIVVILIVTIHTLRKEKKSREKLFLQLDEKNKQYLFDDGEDVEVENEEEAIERLIHNLQNATTFIKEIANGNYNYEYSQLTEDNKELNKNNLSGELLEMKALLVKAKNEEEKRKLEDENRNWTTRGIAKFGDILRQNNDNLELLADNVIRNLIEYLDANQGGLFLYNETEDNDKEQQAYLELVASYAYDRKKFLEKKILPGEGLVGTCALEKQKIYMTKIPESYIEITSGLGGATPDALLIVPLTFDDTFLGVIELATFKEFKPYEIDFVEKISENIASTISTTRINARTADLLSKTQEQAEQMASQEEEMRQNLEELQATQEESARKSAQLEGTFAAINETLGAIEYDLDGNVVTVNDFFLSKFNMIRETVVGKNRKHFYDLDNFSLEQNQEVWDKMLQGEAVTHEKKYTLDDGTELWFKETLKPLTDIHEKIYRVLAIFIDITETKIQQNELQQQAQQMKEQEKELRKSMEELSQTHQQMNKQQEELKENNDKLRQNESIIKQALDEAKEKEKAINEQNEMLKAQEEEMRNNMEQLATMQQELEEKNKEMVVANKKLQTNEQILKKAFENAQRKAQEANEKSTELAKKEKELQKALEKTKESQIEIENKQKQLQQSQQMLQAILNNIPTAIYWKDTDFRYIGANSIFIQNNNLDSLQEIIGKTDYELPWKQNADLFRQNDAKILETRKPLFDYEYKQKVNNEDRWFVVSKIPLIDANNTVYAILGITDDITQRKLRENELVRLKENLENEVKQQTKQLRSNVSKMQRFTHIINQSTNEIYIIHTKTLQILEVNRRAELDTGFISKELMEMTFDKLMPDYPKEKLQKHIKQLVNKKSKYAIFETQFKRNNQSLYHVEINMQLFTLDKEAKIAVIAQDIHQRKQKSLQSEYQIKVRNELMAKKLNEFKQLENELKQTISEKEEQLTEQEKLIDNVLKEEKKLKEEIKRINKNKT